MVKKGMRPYHEDSATGAYAFPVFFLFLGGVMLRLALRHLPLPQWTLREAAVISALLSAAAYLSAASLYGLMLLPLICLAQGMALGLAAEGLVFAAAAGEAISWRALLFFLLQLPALFLLLQRGFSNAACLAEQWLSRGKGAPVKDFLLLTGLFFASALAAFICRG